MTDDTPSSGGPLKNALANAAIAADAAMQATWGLWDQMSPEQRQGWLDDRRRAWPRIDLHLPVILAAAGEIIETEKEA